MPKRCKAAFAVIVRGVPRVVPSGTILADEDPVIKGHEASFEDVGVYVDRLAPRVTETASAAPNEVRTVTPPPGPRPTLPPPPAPKNKG